MSVVITEEIPTPEETLDLYASVGWVAYTKDPDALMDALRGSTYVLSARNETGGLLGLARVISDNTTIAYVQDILVHPESHRSGIGSALMDEILSRSTDLRQIVLLTDTEPEQRAFYESKGFTEIHEVEPAPLRSFVLLKDADSVKLLDE